MVDDEACVVRIPRCLTGDFLSSLLSKDSFSADYPQVSRLFTICLLSALSSVDCERGFSRYNLIKTNLRNRLKVSSISTLLKVCLHPSDLKT